MTSGSELAALHGYLNDTRQEKTIRLHATAREHCFTAPTLLHQGEFLWKRPENSQMPHLVTLLVSLLWGQASKLLHRPPQTSPLCSLVCRSVEFSGFLRGCLEMSIEEISLLLVQNGVRSLESGAKWGKVGHEEDGGR